MELIIGGAFQGKLAYAKASHTEVKWVDGRACTLEELKECGGVHHFHEYIKRVLQEQKSVSELSEIICNENPAILIVSNEVGYGIVPMDAFEREYREAVGRVCTALAEKADKVTRVICGIGTVIKDVAD